MKVSSSKNSLNFIWIFYWKHQLCATNLVIYPLDHLQNQKGSIFLTFTENKQIKKFHINKNLALQIKASGSSIDFISPPQSKKCVHLQVCIICESFILNFMTCNACCVPVSFCSVSLWSASEETHTPKKKKNKKINKTYFHLPAHLFSSLFFHGLIFSWFLELETKRTVWETRGNHESYLFGMQWKWNHFCFSFVAKKKLRKPRANMKSIWVVDSKDWDKKQTWEQHRIEHNYSWIYAHTCVYIYIYLYHGEIYTCNLLIDIYIYINFFVYILFL